jgi:UDP-N-acetylmuramoyl-L-alanyl-D-glutamate--2,6-diaminopimelate ligase
VDPVRLGALATAFGAQLFGADVAVAGVTISSDLVRPGDLFAAVPGSTSHGASFAPAARDRGAVAVLTDPAGLAGLPAGLPVLVVPVVRAVLGPLAAQVYGNPSGALQVVGITGTSGKTTTAYFVRAGLRAAGIGCGLIGTVATLIGDEPVPAVLTTPEAPAVQALLAVMRERGVQTVAMEVSSHALSLGRVDGIEFTVAAFTNLSQDHLDFHKDMEDYFAAKARLFDGRAARHVVVVGDEWGRRMARLAGPGTVTVSCAGEAAADWTAHEVADAPGGGSEFRISGPGVQLPARCAVPGRYNVANAVLAAAILVESGVPAETAVAAVGTAVVPGRMEPVDAGQDFLAVVDYSHKPAAVAGALQALRPLTRGRLIVVLGCGGDRDRAKRPVMGEIAARQADLLVVTDDNPRSEDPAAIRRAMLDGALAVPVAERAEVREIGDRAAAVAAAVHAARSGDTVLVAGRGHETGQEIAGTVHPFDDRVVLRAAIQRQGGTPA